MKRAYITHATKEYLGVAKNLAKSVRMFSDIPFVVYAVGCDVDPDLFDSIENITVKNIDLDVTKFDSDFDYVYDGSGNFYVNRYSTKIYHILCAKTIAMENALLDGWDEVCYLDSDCLATPIVDELFDWCNLITDYPIATQGIHEYMLILENGVQRGNPFGETWPTPDNKMSLEWPLMNFLEMSEWSRGTYRTTGIMLMNQKCLPFIKTWREFCFILPKLVDVTKYAAYHEETIYNVLSWKKTNLGFPLCYVNLREGLDTVKFFFSEKAKEGTFSYDESGKDPSLNFFKIPNDKRLIKVLHGEKRESEVDKILDFLVEINSLGAYS